MMVSSIYDLSFFTGNEAILNFHLQVQFAAILNGLKDSLMMVN